MTNYEKLLEKLTEMFMLDRADLDFGIYRIMNSKRDEILRFLGNDLLPQVRQVLEAAQGEIGAAGADELKQAEEQVRSLGMNPEDSPKVKELRAKYSAGGDLNALEQEVFNHLYSFFRRYYDEGDFLSLRRYKEGVYAIPYEGEEVKLHWANADQYYIKTAEHFRDYTFKVGPENEQRRVHLKLVDAQTEKDNNKASEKRVFILTEENAVAEENGELFIRFEYRSAPDKRKQKDHIEEAVARILAEADGDWKGLLQAKAPTDKNANRTLLEKHLTDYTARNTFDYFIHKDLGGFLRRELDFYIKNEVMHLDDIENEAAPKVEQYLAKVRAIRRVASKLIDFLAQLEDFQKALWLKRKFVVETNYLVSLSLVPDDLLPQIIANDAQREEWDRLLAIDEIPASLVQPSFSGALTVEFLRSNSGLLVDTSHFPRDFVTVLTSSLVDLDAQIDGVLIKGDNRHALDLLKQRFRGKVKSIYIDPPYNTGNDGFVYKDRYQHSSWASMILERLSAGRTFLSQDGAIFASIDEVEQPVFRMLFDQVYGAENHVADMVWAAGRKNDSRLISVSHEYILAYCFDRQHLAANKIEWRQRKKGLEDIYAQYERLRRELGSDYAAMTVRLKTWFKELPDSHPAKAHKHYSHVDKRGIYFPDNISWPGGGGPKYEVRHPVTGKPVKVPTGGWRFSNPEEMQRRVDEDLIHFGKDETSVPCRKSYLRDHENEVPYSVFYQDGRAATNRLRQILGTDDFGYPKDEQVVSELFGMMTSSGEVVLDYFAGSGTTAHAVINLNRVDGAGRKFVLVEMGDHFENVLVPRVKKTVYATAWSQGKPTSIASGQDIERAPKLVKVLSLESYDDCLANLRVVTPSTTQSELMGFNTQMREDYFLRYGLGRETSGSSSLLNIQALEHPFEYRLKIASDSSGETKAVNVDLVETFNWLLGLRVHTMDVIRGFHVVTGRLPGPGNSENGEKALIIWRDTTENPNEKLDEFFAKQAYNTLDQEFDVIYVNGDNNLQNLRKDDQTWKVRLIEEEFHRLMWDVEDV